MKTAMEISPTTKLLSFEAQKTLRMLEYSLPANEWQAVSAWVDSFFRYQQEWLLDWSRFTLLNKARQIGASHTYAAAAVLWALFGEGTTIVSVGEREAIEVLDKARIHAQILVQLGSKYARAVMNSKVAVTFKSGGRILALPATSAGRSFTGNVLLDEFGYHGEHAQKVWDGAGGTMTHGGRLRVMSTPNGVGNLWHETFTDPAKHKGYRLFATTMAEAIEDGLPVDLEQCWKQARNDPRVFDQLFNCKFLGGEHQYLPTEAVTDAATDDLYTYEGDYFAGLDIGRSVDKTVLIVLRKNPISGECRVARIVSCKFTDTELLDKIVQEAFRKFNIKRMCVDSTGMGAFPAERMQKRFGRTRVEPVVFTTNSKEELATTLYSAFTEKLIKIPKTDAALPGLQTGIAAQLRQDLCAIRRERTASGAFRYDAPHTENGHADSAWALALALHASGGPSRRRHEVKLYGGPETIY